MYIKEKLKILLLLLTLIVTQVSCEVDDICLENTTPKLIVNFYDYEKSVDTLIAKSPSNLYLGAIKKDTLYKKVSVDSLVIPLNTTADFTSIWLEAENEKKLMDTLTLKYNRKDVFVSKSCGYKTTFKALNAEHTKHWIKKITVKSTNIENEKETHLHIYF